MGFTSWARACAATLFFSALLYVSSAHAQTVFCLADGTQIAAQRFETKDGKFLLYVSGSDTPLEYPSSSVKGINVSCATAAPSSATAAPTKSSFGIHGSNTIGERLMPMLIETYAEKRHGARPSSKLTASEEQEITIKARDGGTATIDLKAHGSGTSAKDLIDGKSIIGMSSRRINPAETDAVTARFGVNPQLPGNEHVLALDGLAVIVNPSNPVKGLSLGQIARIFSGQITNWADVGGNNGTINVYRRDDKSGTTDTFKSLVLAADKLNFTTAAKAFESSETVSSSVASDPNGIGYIGFPYINKNHPLDISSACGITSSPSNFTVKTEDYPLARRLYLYTIGTPPDPIARDLLQFALSDEAQATVREAEFIDQSIVNQDDGEQRAWLAGLAREPQKGLLANAQVPSDGLRGLQSLSRMARRTSMVFRFESGKSDLDTRAQQDVGRLARYLNSPAGAGKRFFIVGFADSRGSWPTNRDLAMRRAAQVRQELEKLGVRVPRDSLLSMSYLAPVACSDDDIGLAKNRRAEIWISP